MKHRIAILNKQKKFLQKQRTGGGQNRSFLEGGISGRGLDLRKGGWKVNVVEILYIHVCQWKNETC
jgi:hypothetical protein